MQKRSNFQFRPSPVWFRKSRNIIISCGFDYGFVVLSLYLRQGGLPAGCLSKRAGAIGNQGMNRFGIPEKRN